MSTRHDRSTQFFASDNYAGAHPAVVEAMADANGGHVRSYGADPYTATLRDRVKDLFGANAEVFPTLTGTGSNVVALQALAARHESVVCARTAHVHVDEGGAPERLGLKLLTVPTTDGKLTVDHVDVEAWGWGDQHRGQPGVLSITQSSELGTVYTPDEIAVLADHAHAQGMRVHLDGARLANAAAHLGVPVRAFTTDAGVDIVSFGATKNGALGAEAVIVLDDRHNDALPYLRKGSAQLTSKMRFVSAQFLALLEDDRWLELATHANAMARRLADGVIDGDAVRLAYPVQANAVFAHIDPALAPALADELGFYVWDGPSGLVRWMTSWDSTEASVDGFAAALVERLSNR
jgi:threonine aldolase